MSANMWCRSTSSLLLSVGSSVLMVVSFDPDRVPFQPGLHELRVRCEHVRLCTHFYDLHGGRDDWLWHHILAYDIVECGLGFRLL